MRIPIFYNIINHKKYFLHIESKYKCTNVIVPIGNDCHPAYVLQKLHLRKFSLPFDWLNNHPIKALAYAHENLSNNFIHFLKELKRNEKGVVVANKYPYCEFLHNSNLIESNEEKNKFKRRIDRVLKILKNKNVYFLNNVPATAFENQKSVYEYINNLSVFLNNHSTKEGGVFTYIRFDDFFYENDNLNKLFSELESLSNSFKEFKYTKYIRENKDYPTWGNPKNYVKLLNDLKLPIKRAGVKIYIKNS